MADTEQAFSAAVESGDVNTVDRILDGCDHETQARLLESIATDFKKYLLGVSMRRHQDKTFSLSHHAHDTRDLLEAQWMKRMSTTVDHILQRLTAFLMWLALAQYMFNTILCQITIPFLGTRVGCVIVMMLYILYKNPLPTKWPSMGWNHSDLIICLYLFNQYLLCSINFIAITYHWKWVYYSSTLMSYIVGVSILAGLKFNRHANAVVMLMVLLIAINMSSGRVFGWSHSEDDPQNNCVGQGLALMMALCFCNLLHSVSFAPNFPRRVQLRHRIDNIIVFIPFGLFILFNSWWFSYQEILPLVGNETTRHTTWHLFNVIEKDSLLTGVDFCQQNQLFLDDNYGQICLNMFRLSVDRELISSLSVTDICFASNLSSFSPSAMSFASMHTNSLDYDYRKICDEAFLRNVERGIVSRKRLYHFIISLSFTTILLN